MKTNTSRALTIAISAALAIALAGFVVSPALGGPGFITKKKAAKVYLSKKSAKKTYLAQQAADDRYYRKGDVFSRDDANAKFPDATGDIRVPVFPTSWFLPSVPSGVAPSATISYFRIGATNATPAVDAFTPIGFPTVLYGRSVTLKGFEICQRFSSTGVSLNQIGLTKIPGDSSNPTVDPVGLTQTYAQAVTLPNGCQSISVPSAPLSPNEPMYLSLRFAIPAGEALRLGRATMILGAG